MRFFSTTKTWGDWWRRRKIDWIANQDWQHPHRFMISSILRRLNWISLFEIGCGSGANLINIVKTIPGRQVGGCDINPEAIEVANRTFQGAFFKVCPADDVMMSDKSVDIILTDALMIYISPKDFKKHLREFRRVGRKYLVMCELHEPNFLKRYFLKFREGLNSYNWKKVLESNGFYDISLYKIPKDVWSVAPWKQNGYIVVATIPKR